jgi:hypothetical protein
MVAGDPKRHAAHPTPDRTDPPITVLTEVAAPVAAGRSG